MKKLMMIAALMVAALTASAQNDDLKNEFGVYYGFGAASDIFSVSTMVSEQPLISFPPLLMHSHSAATISTDTGDLSVSSITITHRPW